jgi:hypothetical protein
MTPPELIKFQNENEYQLVSSSHHFFISFSLLWANIHSPLPIISSFLTVYYGRISIRPYRSFWANINSPLPIILGEYQFAPTNHFGRISIRPYRSLLHFLLFIMGEYPFAPTDHPLVASSLFSIKKGRPSKPPFSIFIGY